MYQCKRQIGSSCLLFLKRHRKALRERIPAAGVSKENMSTEKVVLPIAKVSPVCLG